MAATLIPKDSPVRKAAKHRSAHQDPGHVYGLSHIAEGAGLTHQIPLQGRQGWSSLSLGQPPTTTSGPSDLRCDGGREGAAVIDPAILAALRGHPLDGGVGAQEGPLRLHEAPAWLRGPKPVQGYGGPQPGPRVIGGCSVIGGALAVVAGHSGGEVLQEVVAGQQAAGQQQQGGVDKLEATHATQGV